MAPASKPIASTTWLRLPLLSLLLLFGVFCLGRLCWDALAATHFALSVLAPNHQGWAAVAYLNQHPATLWAHPFVVGGYIAMVILVAIAALAGLMLCGLLVLVLYTYAKYPTTNWDETMSASELEAHNDRVRQIKEDHARSDHEEAERLESRLQPKSHSNALSRCIGCSLGLLGIMAAVIQIFIPSTLLHKGYTLALSQCVSPGTLAYWVTSGIMLYLTYCVITGLVRILRHSVNYLREHPQSAA